MAIRLKNNYLSKAAYLLAVVLLGYSIVTAGFCAVYYENITKDTYFKSNNFMYEVEDLNRNIIGYHIYYKDYAKKTLDEKVTQEEIDTQKKMDEDNLKQRTEQINSNYNWQIDDAERSGDKDRLKRLTDEKNKELDASKKEFTRTVEEIKKVLAVPKDDEFNRYKSGLSSQTGILYYLTNRKTGEIYTSMPDSSNIDDYINSSTLWSQKFPTTYQGPGNYAINQLNRTMEENRLEGYFFVPAKIDGYSHIYTDYKNYQYIRENVINGGIAGAKIFSLSLLLFIIAAIFKDNPLSSKGCKSLYIRIPMELRLALFISVTVLYLYFLFEAGGSILNESKIVYMAFTSAFSLYLLFALPHIRGFFKLLTDKDYFISQVKATLIYRMLSLFRRVWNSIRESFVFSSPIAYVSILIFSSIVFGIIFLILASGDIDRVGGFIILIFMAGYLVFLYKFVLKQIGYFNKIVKGSDAIVSGNLTYIIPENGKSILSKLAHNVNNIKSGLQEALQSEMKSERLKSELITNVSHDLKTPLTSIVNYVDLLKRDDLSKEEMQNYVEILNRKTQRLRMLIEDLFEASKMSSGSVELNMEELDISALLRQSLAEFEEKIKASSLTFRINIPDKKLLLKLDGKKTWRVFENLLGNIIKYSQPSTRVYIDLVEQNNKISVIMKNISGYEMDFSVDEIFERFKRGDKSRHTEGSGLGLAIAKSIVELEGGKLDIEIDGDLFKVIIEFMKH